MATSTKTAAKTPKERKAPSEALLAKTGSDSEVKATYPVGTRAPEVAGKKISTAALNRRAKKLGI